MSAYDEQMRTQLTELVRGNGVEPGRARQIVDLACHAADRLISALIEALDAAPEGAKLIAMELARQLAPTRMRGICEHVPDLGRSLGLPQAKGQVEVAS